MGSEPIADEPVQMTRHESGMDLNDPEAASRQSHRQTRLCYLRKNYNLL